MLCILNTEDFDDDFISLIKAAEKKIFITDKLRRGNNLTVFARVLLGYMLKKKYGISAFSYRYGEKGKPYILNSDVFFSISHSGKYVMCCTSDKEVGCDIEKVKDYNPKISSRFFTEKETLLLENSECRERLFTKLWTLKEGILKKEGTGIAGGLDSYCFADFADKDEFFAYGCFFYSVSFGEYMISVCSETDYEKLQTVKKEDIAEYIKNLN